VFAAGFSGRNEDVGGHERVNAPSLKTVSHDKGFARLGRVAARTVAVTPKPGFRPMPAGCNLPKIGGIQMD
jgi:hypothetical protein